MEVEDGGEGITSGFLMCEWMNGEEEILTEQILFGLMGWMLKVVFDVINYKYMGMGSNAFYSQYISSLLDDNQVPLN